MAYKDGNRHLVATAAAAASAANVNAMWPGHAAASYDATVRTGMEMFVPAAVVAAMV